LGELYGLRRVVEFMNAERQRQNLTQNELAERSGMPSGTASRILSGATSPELESLEKLARGLGYDLIPLLALAVGGYAELEVSGMALLFYQMTPEHRQVLMDVARSLRRSEERERGQDAAAPTCPPDAGA
jgi:transcriptional regulator with XRE-family HTH domain